MKLLLSFFCCCSLFFCQAQSKTDIQIDSILSVKDRATRIELLTKLEASSISLDSLQKGRLYHVLGLDLYRAKKYQKSVESVEKAVAFKESIREIDPTSFQKSLNLLNSSYNKYGDQEMRLKTLYRILGEKQRTKYTHFTLDRLSKYHFDIGDYYKSIDYANRVLYSYSKHKDKKYFLKALRRVVDCYAALGSDNPHILEEIASYKNLLKNDFDALRSDQKMGYYNSLGLIHRELGQKEQALNYYQKALKNTSDKTSQNAMHSLYINIGEMYSQLEQDENAQVYYQKVLATKDSVNISAVYNNLGYYHEKTIDKEIELHKKALQILEKESGVLGDAFFPEEIKDSQYKREFLAVFLDLSQAWIKKYYQDENPQYLEEALKIYYRIDHFISVLRLSSSSKASKLFWINNGVNSYLEAVKVCYLLNKPEEAFYFMEKNKSLYLLEQLVKVQLKNKYKIPSKLLKREEHLKYQMLQAKYGWKQQQEDKKLQRRYQKTFQVHATFIDSLKIHFSDFFTSPLQQEIISLVDFQQFLKEQQDAQAVEYIMGEKEGYALLVSADTVQFFKLENYRQLKRGIKDFKDMCQESIATEEQVKAYKKLGFSLFQSLFPFENATEKLSSKALKIIPSGVLYNFPFEALLVEEQGAFQENFLIQKVEVSYLNSLLLHKIYTTQKYLLRILIWELLQCRFNRRNL
jgi:tetratricopeptide (TPR) repeat protein